MKFNLKELANSIKNIFNGKLTSLKNGYKIEVPNGNKSIIVRIMDEGSGGRGSPYFRISIDGKGSLTFRRSNF